MFSWLQLEPNLSGRLMAPFFLSMVKKSLQSSEWLLVGSLLAILASLVLVAKINLYLASETLSNFHLEPEKLIDVTISGAVLKPGVYQVSQGTLLENALKKARPKKNACLKKIDGKQMVETPLDVVLEELSEIVVSVEGAVEETAEVRLEPGARICDLKSKIRLTEEADRRFLKRRRILKDGEKITIPKKSVE